MVSLSSMAVKKLIRMGNPVLRQIAHSLTVSDILSAEFKSLLEDLKDTMKLEGGIGIAAPQIGISQQVAIIELPASSERYPEIKSSPLFVIVNPVLTALDETPQGFWEGCLSVPGLRGYVERPRKIRVEYLDEQAQAQSLELEGFLATVFQHELDHLFGKLYIDRIKDPTQLSFIEEFEQFILPQTLAPNLEE